jgi:hypothetical protein
MIQAINQITFVKAEIPGLSLCSVCGFVEMFLLLQGWAEGLVAIAKQQSELFSPKIWREN